MCFLSQSLKPISIWVKRSYIGGFSMSEIRIRPSFFLYHRVKVGKLEKNVKLGVHDGKSIKEDQGVKNGKFSSFKFLIGACCILFPII